MPDLSNRDESRDERNPEINQAQSPHQSAGSTVGVSSPVSHDRRRMQVRKGLLWTFKKGGQFGTDEWTVTVVDILEKRVMICAHLNGSDFTCAGPASLELRLVSMTLLVEEVGCARTRLRILSEQRFVIRRN